ncbi:MAG TPA: membrane protein insertion efficiency factor YidD [Patescibacteria group bacterium]|nr:membrane protein insertion efficiency factor YidD [Patescibacteria group bacterium]
MFVKQILLLSIRFYQKTLSPDHGIFRFMFPHGYCRFYPTCSEYAHNAIHKHGARRGSILGVKRLLRCHPLSKPAVDLVP